MPLYLDHHDIPGVTAVDLAIAHPHRGTAFSWWRAPTRSAWNQCTCKASAEHVLSCFSRKSHTKSGAGDETRTRDIDLGKVALYQLSYSRSASRILASPFRSSWHIGQMTTINSAMRAAVRLIWVASKTSTA